MGFFLFKSSYNNTCNFDENIINKFTQKKVTAYILNLDRAIERLQFILPQVLDLGIPYERIPAIDGNTLNGKELANIADIESYKNYFKMFPEPGTIGCTLSHEKALKSFLSSDNEFAVIFEDDVQFDPKELSEIITSVIEKKHLWDIVGFELNHNGNPLKIANISQKKYLALYMTNVKHAGAYIINRVAAHKLLKKIYPIKMPFDHYYTHSWEFRLIFCGIEPRVVEQKFGDSQIKSANYKKIKSLSILIRNAIYNVYTSLMHIMYNFYCYLFSHIK